MGVWQCDFSRYWSIWTEYASWRLREGCLENCKPIVRFALLSLFLMTAVDSHCAVATTGWRGWVGYFSKELKALSSNSLFADHRTTIIMLFQKQCLAKINVFIWVHRSVFGLTGRNNSACSSVDWKLRKSKNKTWKSNYYLSPFPFLYFIHTYISLNAKVSISKQKIVSYVNAYRKKDTRDFPLIILLFPLFLLTH